VSSGQPAATPVALAPFTQPLAGAVCPTDKNAPPNRQVLRVHCSLEFSEPVLRAAFELVAGGDTEVHFRAFKRVLLESQVGLGAGAQPAGGAAARGVEAAQPQVLAEGLALRRCRRGLGLELAAAAATAAEVRRLLCPFWRPF
jgi:hypothetical protein